MIEQARSLARVDKIAQNLRRDAKKGGWPLSYTNSLEQAARECGFATYSDAKAALPANDPTPVPRS